jgi:hypothetical protein
MLAPPIIEEILNRIRNDVLEFGIFRDAADPLPQTLSGTNYTVVFYRGLQFSVSDVRSAIPGLGWHDGGDGDDVAALRPTVPSRSFEPDSGRAARFGLSRQISVIKDA